MNIYKFHVAVGVGFLSLTIPAESHEEAMWIALEILNG